MISRRPHVVRCRVLSAILAALLMTLGLLCSFSTSEADDDGPALPDPVVVRADQRGIVLEWQAGDFALRRESGEDGRPYTIVEAPGWEQSETPGHPQLPLASILAVVPPTGDATLRIQVLESERRSLAHPVMPAPSMEPVGDPPVGLEPAWARDERAYAGARSPSKATVTLEEAGWVRGRRLVRLTFHPMRYDPAKTGLEIARRTRVELRFAGSTAAASGWADDDAFTPILQRAVINPKQVIPFARTERWAAASRAANEQALGAQAAPTDTEYLIIAHADFVTAVAPLAQHRAISDGLKVFSTTTQAIYDTYSGGEASAAAIRHYVSATYHAPSAPVLDYVLLVGDGTEDGSGGNYVPPYTVYLTPSWYSGTLTVTTDNRFVTMDGPTDEMADVFVGRLPVNSPAEAETVVEKITSYASNPPQWPWNERILFLAGNQDTSKGESFHSDTNEVYDTLPVTFTGRRVYFCTQDCTEPHHYDTITTAHDATIRVLNGGGLLAGYMGHSSWHQWAVDPKTWAPMLHVSDVASLNSEGALPVILEMTCYTSRFAYPEGDTLDETLLRRAGGGTVATWGPTDLACTSGQRTLYNRFVYDVFRNSTIELGAASQYAKSFLSTEQMDLHDIFVLLGDPAMALNLTIVPWSDELFLPLVMRSG